MTDYTLAFAVPDYCGHCGFDLDEIENGRLLHPAMLAENCPFRGRCIACIAGRREHLNRNN